LAGAFIASTTIVTALVPGSPVAVGDIHIPAVSTVRTGVDASVKVALRPATTRKQENRRD
jgi:hypothetical protein